MNHKEIIQLDDGSRVEVGFKKGIDCPGPRIMLPGGWVVHDCDNCILFPCPDW